MVSIREYATQQGISYEAVRRKVKRYHAELADHVEKRGRTQYLDDEAVAFLNEHRQENAVSIIDGAQSLKQLQNENKALLLKVTQLQEAIISRDAEIKQLQADKVQLLEDKTKPLTLWQRIFGK